jgi:competence protein ComEC
MSSWGLMPFVRILFMFLPGLLIGLVLPDNEYPWYALLLFLVIAAFYLVSTKKNKNGLVVVTIFVLGCCVSIFYQIKNPFERLTTGKQQLSAIVSSTPIEKTHVIAVKLKSLSSSGTTLAYLSKDMDVTVTDMEVGDTIHLSGYVSDVKGPQNPHEFDYQNYLLKQRICQTWYVNDTSSISLKKGKAGIFTFANRCRNWAEKRLHILNLGEHEAIVKALLLGLKEDLSDEVKHTFANTGAMHVLAVSGLHVGIIFMVLHTILKHIRRNSIGQICYAVMMLACIWSFAFIAGLAPSVLRAAIMFSLFIIAKSLKRQVNIYNAIAASAFLMLSYNPNLLFDVGFQLSYCAVAGIVFFHPKIYAWFGELPKLLDWAWSLTAVSIAAQLATIPFTVYYFHQLPVYFWVSNLLVIPAAIIILYTGISYLVLGLVPLVEKMAGVILDTTVGSLTALIQGVSNWPLSTIRPIYVHPVLLFCLVTAILVFVVFVINRSRKYLKLSLVLLVCFFAGRLLENVSHEKQKGKVLFHIRNEIALLYYQGKSGVLFTSASLTNKQVSYHIQGHVDYLNLNSLDTLLISNDAHFQLNDNLDVQFLNETAVPEEKTDSSFVRLAQNDVVISTNELAENTNIKVFNLDGAKMW